MSISNIKNKLKKNSKKDTTWIENAKFRKENENWLDISFDIAVKIHFVLSANKKANTFPKSQKELAKAMNCTPQYINKVLKGTENLQLETIAKISDILNIKLIEVPQFETTIQVTVPKYTSYIKSDELIDIEANTSNYADLLDSFIYNDEPECKLKLVA